MEENVHSSASDINSEEAAKNETHLMIPRKKRICLVGAAKEDPALGTAAQQFSVPVLKSQTGLEYVDDTTFCTYFILKKFEGQEYDFLHKSPHRILGPTALLQLAEKKESLPSINRPMYTQAMLGTIVVFTGFRKKEELTQLINMIHHMGGSVRKEIGSKVTHLIANCCGGEKYRYAVTFRVPIMSTNWVNNLWEMRDNINSYSNSEDMINTYKLKPFFGARVCFFGFPEDEKSHMVEVLHQQGGESTDINDPLCTHVVTDLEKRRYIFTKSQKKLMPYYKMVNEYELSLSKSNANRDTSATNRNSLPYSFAYYNPYTCSIPSPVKSIYTLNQINFPNFHAEMKTNSIGYDNSVNYDEITTLKNFNEDLEDDATILANLIQDSMNEDIVIFKKDYNDNREKVFISNDFCEKLVNSSQDSNISDNCEDLENSISTIFAETNDLTITDQLIMNKEANSFIKNYLGNTNLSHKTAHKFQFSKSEPRLHTSISRETLKDVDLRLPMKHPEFRKIISPRRCKIPPSYRTPPYSKKKNSAQRYKWKRPLSTHYQKPKNFESYQQENQDSSKRHSYHFDSSPCNFGFNNLRPPDEKKVTIIRKKSMRAITKALTKISEIVFPSSSKQFMTVTPPRTNLPKQKDEIRQKYIPLPQSPIFIPAKVARLTIETDNWLKNSKESESTMVVVDESNVVALPDLASSRAHIVKAEWFWTSVQNEGAADEKEYLFEDYLESITSPISAVRRDSQIATPTTASRRKRKRLAETLSSLVQNGGDSPALHKRRSSISDAGHLSVSGSFLDCTASPDKQLLDDIPEVEAVNTDSRKNLSPRHQVFLELVQTESNYVGILSTIMTLFKSPLENAIETSDELLNSTEAKIIFGNFPPIYEVHKKMLAELRYCAAHWSEENSIGNIILKYASDLMKAYPPYVNFFENTKEMLDQCDQNKPRFHAFLKVCQTKPECGRQSLKELLIKPVQRLPSISLLLNDIHKHTNKNNPDCSALEKSLSSIKEVMTYINEDKRKTEGQLAMFDIFNEIDNCPPHLVSSHRSFIGKCDVQELSEGLSGRGDHLVLFLFTDMLEICKKRSKAFNSMKSPNTVSGMHTVKMNSGKPYKHIKMLSLTTVKKVYDIRETEECRKVFALLVRSNQELKDKLYSFTITDEEVNKINYLRTLCRQMANTICQADADKFLICLESHQLEIDTSDVALGTLSKAFKFASRTRMKVGRALSFNKTPSKLKHAMSTMMSPFGSTHSLTPASQQLAQMRLASCTNLNEIHNGSSSSPSRDEVLVTPMSVQPTRKAKCSTLSIASLRRL